MGYKISRIRTTLFRISRNIGDMGEDIVYSVKKTFYKPRVNEKTIRVFRGVSRIGNRIKSNIKTNTRNWGERIYFGENFRINKDDV